MQNPYYINKDNNDNNKIINGIDLNLNNYTLEDIFKILNININEIVEKDEYEIRQQIEQKLDQVITKFNNINLTEFARFFENIKSKLIKDEEIPNDSSNSQADLVINQNVNFNAEKNYNLVVNNSTDTTDKSLFTSTVNPITRKTVQKVLNIDSRYRKNYENTLSTNFKFDLPVKLNNIIEMKLNDLEMTNTYYVISNIYNNNFFWFKITTVDLFEVYGFLFIDPQSYYDQDIVQNINDRFNLLGTGANFNLDLTYQNNGNVPDGSGKMIITVTDSRFLSVELNFSAPMIPNFIESNSYNANTESKQYIYIFDLTGSFPKSALSSEDNFTLDYIKQIYNTKDTASLNSKLGWLFGFRNEKTIIDTVELDDGTRFGKIFSEGVVNLLGPRYFYLCINDFNHNYNNTFISSNENDIVKANVFARINNQGTPFSIVPNSSYQITTVPRYYFGPVDIEKIEIQIVDEYNRIVDLNGSDISLTLTLTCVYS
jgi:hypothetical protein